MAWRRWIVVAIGSLMVVPLPAVAPTVAVEAAGGDAYVAFGDSFVAGPGIAPQLDDCSRSGKNFPSLVATALAVASFTDASCSGARLDHLWSVQGTNPPQLDALGPDTTLVTFGTLGGNDLGLVKVATTCFLDTCSGTLDDARHAAVEALLPEILTGLADTRARAPKADIVVVGYSHYIPPESCAAIGGISPDEAVYFQGLVDHLSDVLERAATEAGVAFADMDAIPGVADHTVCAPPAQQWVRGIDTYGDGAPLHPSTCGMAAYAQQVTRTVQAFRGQPVDAFVDPCPALAQPPTTPPTTGSTSLEQAAASLRLTRRCTTSGRVVVRVRGGKGLAGKARFSIGRHLVARDRSAPFGVRHSARRLARHPGRVRTRVVLRLDGARVARSLSATRPRCLR